MSAIVRLPHNAVILPVAPAARGKSTLAASLLTSMEKKSIVSTDAIRGELCPTSPCSCRDAQEGCTGGETCQCRNGLVFRIAARRIDELLLAGDPVFFDGTNLAAKTRRAEVERAHAAGRPAVALLATSIPLEELVRRNSGRTRNVPEHVLERMRNNHLQITPDSLLAEGFDRVEVWDDTTQVVLLPSGADWSGVPGPFAIIGDVHGSIHTLQAHLAGLGFNPDLSHPEGLFPVFLGDLHDKGGALAAGPQGSGDPASSGAVATLRFLMEAVRTGRAVCTDSNHGNKLARLIANPERIHVGPALAETWADLLVQPDAIEFLEKVHAFLTSCPTSLLLPGGPTGKIVAAHAAMRRDLVGVSSKKAGGFCNYQRSFEWYGPETVVVGHVVVEEPSRERSTASAGGEVIRVDTGAYEGGGLTAYLTEEDSFLTTPTDPRDLPSPARRERNMYRPE